jgi:hypothetical protein
MMIPLRIEKCSNVLCAIIQVSQKRYYAFCCSECCELVIDGVQNEQYKGKIIFSLPFVGPGAAYSQDVTIPTPAILILSYHLHLRLTTGLFLVSILKSSFMKAKCDSVNTLRDSRRLYGQNLQPPRHPISQTMPVLAPVFLMCSVRTHNAKSSGVCRSTCTKFVGVVTLVTAYKELPWTVGFCGDCG